MNICYISQKRKKEKLYFSYGTLADGSPHGIVTNVLDCNFVVSEFDSSQAIPFTFRLILLGKE